MPFLKTLGYDVFNPSIVMPEYTADIGTKKAKKWIMLFSKIQNLLF